MLRADIYFANTRSTVTIISNTHSILSATSTSFVPFPGAFAHAHGHEYGQSLGSASRAQNSYGRVFLITKRKNGTNRRQGHTKKTRTPWWRYRKTRKHMSWNPQHHHRTRSRQNHPQHMFYANATINTSSRHVGATTEILKTSTL